ncbi:opacity family porin [Avibacterium paragallinarum]|uniref:opacity family porin n=1 Tax=Avibacterium paragallinarum TaxID=728 RepID=UPI0021F7D6E8|nr:opacity family porin [Avibacterium paragallinarum]UXN37231.1 opacity family porin [Avibacterium paragallinarum]
MKKLLAVALGALVVSATANANWYVQGDLGYSKLKFTEYSELNKTQFEPRISVGYKLNDWRFAADFTYYGKSSASHNNESISAKGYGIGLSGIYDLDFNLPVKPYVGVRLATNIFRIENSLPGAFEEKTQTKFGYGALAGVSYDLAPNLILDTGVEYNRLGSWEDTKVNQYGVKVGLRYEF